MLTGDIKNQIDKIWDAFWSGGISNPLEVIAMSSSSQMDLNALVLNASSIQTPG